ncbi:MAG: winged helix-turn-helix transcriptional regulator [Candidatus Hermodarchaeota archaeon]
MINKKLKQAGLTECPIEKTISLVGSKWSLMILRELYLQNKPMRFNELLKALGKISSKTLSAKLKELTKCGIINRNVIPKTPIIINYELTEKGKAFNKVQDAMAEWSLEWNM